MGRLYEGRVCQNFLNLILRSVALDVLFVEYISEVRTLPYAMNDIFANLCLSFVVVVATEELVPPRPVLLAHNTLLLPSPRDSCYVGSIDHKLSISWLSFRKHRQRFGKERVHYSRSSSSATKDSRSL